jgi:hypothetical protein
LGEPPLGEKPGVDQPDKEQGSKEKDGYGWSSERVYEEGDENVHE